MGHWGPEGEKTPYYGFKYGTYPSIDGSTVAVPMGLEFARQHLGLTDEDATSFVNFKTTHDAYMGLISKDSALSAVLYDYCKDSGYEDSVLSEHDHPTDIVIATYPSEEEQAAAERASVKLAIEPVCYDAFVFITNKSNPVDSLTLDQVRGIYTGRITSWSQVGGEYIPIAAYQREENSGSQSGMEQLVMSGVAMAPPETARIVEGMGGLVDAVAEYQNSSASIGYTYKYYIDTLYKNESIKILKIDGVSADPENLASKRYPLTVSYYGAIREEDGPDSIGRKFLDWMLSDEGQKCIALAGYVPLSGKVS
jgi:phosphate transport system substrate-binding protein